MCGIAGILQLARQPIPLLGRCLDVMNDLMCHRGPDDAGTWQHPAGHLGLAHRRLSIIDLATGRQPMTDRAGNWIVFNGEIYNYIELRRELGLEHFVTTSDTEVILLAYARWGADCVCHLRGMFAFALWDEANARLFCARDRFGIKPFYYAVVDQTLYFGSEVKTLLPFLPDIATDLDGLKDYLAFQFCLDGKTLFRGVRELLPGHTLTVQNAALSVERYWEVQYEPDFDHTEAYFARRLRDLVEDAVRMHLRADVPVGAYLSGGLDSSIIASLASEAVGPEFQAFNGRFDDGPEYDESRHARTLARQRGFTLHETRISPDDFAADIRRVIYHLDYPVAGPGSFPQFIVSRLARRHMKVVLGGQGGDEIFGGYTRYLIAYFEQCVKAAIDGTMHDGNFVVTIESIIPNLTALRNYKPMLQEFWRDGLFDELDKRYFRLINRSPNLAAEIDWEALGNHYWPYETFRAIFQASNVRKESYFDSMTHFDFKTLLPALLQVEDRVSMAHGLESRVPFIDHPLVEFAATMPANVKFKDGAMKHILKQAMADILPPSILARQDKMGFPVPLQEWFQGPLHGFVRDIFGSRRALERDLFHNQVVLDEIDREPKFGRKIWGLLSLELWQEEFHDRAGHFRALLDKGATA